MNVLGFALGPLFWGPASEVLGRRAVHLYSFIPFAIFNSACCGCQSIEALLAVRFFCGCFGSSAMTNAGYDSPSISEYSGTIADIFDAKRRGMAMGIWAIAPWAGPTLGPIVYCISQI
jgi:MFS family permease